MKVANDGGNESTAEHLKRANIILKRAVGSTDAAYITHLLTAEDREFATLDALDPKVGAGGNLYRMKYNNNDGSLRDETNEELL